MNELMDSLAPKMYKQGFYVSIFLSIMEKKTLVKAICHSISWSGLSRDFFGCCKPWLRDWQVLVLKVTMMMSMTMTIMMTMAMMMTMKVTTKPESRLARCWTRASAPTALVLGLATDHNYDHVWKVLPKVTNYDHVWKVWPLVIIIIIFDQFHASKKKLNPLPEVSGSRLREDLII